MIWELAMDAGDKVRSAPQQESLPPLRKGFVINLPSIKAVLADTTIPKQARALAQLFLTEQFDFYTSEEMRTLMKTQRAYAALKTRQDAWRIFRYYRPTLVTNGVINDHTGD